LSQTFDSNDLRLDCDPKRIQQVLYNLLTNAIKFTPQNSGKIEVSVKRVSNIEQTTGSSPQLLFSVKDNGLGIAKDKQQNLFKKFYQVDTSLTRNTGGTGLGLAISKGIIEAHNGKIWIESDGIDGEGSVFLFSLPVGSTNNGKIPIPVNIRGSTTPAITNSDVTKGRLN